jgi:D-lactate dehydrogenase
MNTKNIYFIEVETEDTEKIKKAFPQAKIINKTLSEKEIISQCQEAEILCVFIYSRLSKKVLKHLLNLKLIATRSVGYDHIDLRAALERNIKVCNVPDYGSHVIAEHVFALLLSGIRKIGQGEDKVRKENDFNFHGLRGIALKGKTLGVVGTGKIGKNVARIASLGFLMDVVAFDAFPDKDTARENHFSYVSLEKLWQKSDIISLHCPLTPKTKHLINKKAISKMKNGVILINTSRGGVVDTKALIAGLKNKKISHALLDVLEHEKNIKENKKLLNSPGVIITPHIAFYADDSMKKMYNESFASINRFIKNKKLIHQVLGI